MQRYKLYIKVESTPALTNCKNHTSKVVFSIIGRLSEKKELIESVSTSIKGVLDADRKKLIMMNVYSDDLDKVKDVMPSMGGLTISEVLSDKKTVAVQAVIDEKEVFELVNDLRNAGAHDILVVPIERII